MYGVLVAGFWWWGFGGLIGGVMAGWWCRWWGWSWWQGIGVGTLVMVRGFGWGFLCGGIDGGAMVVESLMKML